MTSIHKLIILSTVLSVHTTFAQNNAELYNTGLKLKLEFKNREALPIFQKLLKSDSGNVNYLQNASYMYCKVGNIQTTEGEKIKYYKIAEYLAKKAIFINEKNADNHYVYALALGRLSENTGSKQKIANAKIIKKEAERAIELNPKHVGAYHILGRWHRSIAGFSSVEKIAINNLFGGVPQGGSYDDAVKCFMKAIQYDPKYMLHQYELALTFHEMKKNIEAKLWTIKAMEMSVNNEDDKNTMRKCEELLKKLN